MRDVRELPAPDPAEQRDVLVAACIDVADVVASEALRARLVEALADVGVEPDAPIGAHFDPRRHEAVGACEAPVAEAHNRVATVERVGWRDGDRVLRLPRVVVHRRADAR